MVYDNEIVGKRLKILRQNKGLKQSDLANYLGIAQATYSAFETGKNDLSVQTLFRISDFYKISTDWILGLNENMSESDFDDTEMSQIELFKNFIRSKRIEK